MSARAMAAIARLLLAAAPLAACTTYQETRQKLNTGYYDDLKLQAQREADLAKDEQIRLQRDLTTLQQQQATLDAQAASAEQQLKTIDADLARASRQLDQARSENRVSREQYDKLRAELDSLRLQQQKQSLVTEDPAEKRRQLEELQKRKLALQRAIQALGGG
jgi:chromosome segregation ATPase